MSQRHKPGDIVRIPPGAGFTPTGDATPRRWQLCEGFESWCYHECGDDDCEEWVTLQEVDADGKPTGRVACHVCDCEMEGL